MADLKHNNIVCLIGVCMQEEPKVLFHFAFESLVKDKVSAFLYPVMLFLLCTYCNVIFRLKDMILVFFNTHNMDT